MAAIAEKIGAFETEQKLIISVLKDFKDAGVTPKTSAERIPILFHLITRSLRLTKNFFTVYAETNLVLTTKNDNLTQEKDALTATNAGLNAENERVKAASAASAEAAGTREASIQAQLEAAKAASQTALGDKDGALQQLQEQLAASIKAVKAANTAAGLTQKELAVLKEAYAAFAAEKADEIAVLTNQLETAIQLGSLGSLDSQKGKPKGSPGGGGAKLRKTHVKRRRRSTRK